MLASDVFLSEARCGRTWHVVWDGRWTLILLIDVQLLK